MSVTAPSFSVGWDVGAWRTHEGDALWILDSAGNTLGRWHGNLLPQISAGTSPDEFVHALFDCCEATSPALDSFVTLAIDAPLAFPNGIMELLNGKTKSESEDDERANIDNPYLFRRTEAFTVLHRTPKRNPFSAIQDMIGSQFTKVLHVLNKFALKHDGKGVWRTSGSRVRVIEAYPAMSKTTLNDVGLVEPVKSVFESQIVNHTPATDDERDALICAIVAHLHAHAPEMLHPPEGEYFNADEGWIWFPKKMTAETFESLWAYCTTNNRLVPMPPKWNDLFGMLRNARQKPSGGWHPPLPLILAEWHHSSPIEKQLRFKVHLEWAQQQGQLAEVSTFLRSLDEDQWCHFGEV